MFREEPFGEEKLRVLIHSLVKRQCAAMFQRWMNLDEKALLTLRWL